MFEKVFSQNAFPLWTALAAVAASLSALFAAVYTFLTFRLVRMQDEPKVVVFVRNDPDRQTILMITVKNIGGDVATDVRFTPSRPIPRSAFGLSVESAKPAEIMSDGPLVEGIPVLGPGDSRDITWGQFAGLMKAVGNEPIEIRYYYRHGHRHLRGSSKLEVLSFTGTDASENPEAVIAENVKKLAKSAETIASELAAVRQSIRR